MQLSFQLVAKANSCCRTIKKADGGQAQLSNTCDMSQPWFHEIQKSRKLAPEHHRMLQRIKGHGLEVQHTVDTENPSLLKATTENTQLLKDPSEYIIGTGLWICNKKSSMTDSQHNSNMSASCDFESVGVCWVHCFKVLDSCSCLQPATCSIKSKRPSFIQKTQKGCLLAGSKPTQLKAALLGYSLDCVGIDSHFLVVSVHPEHTQE